MGESEWAQRWSRWLGAAVRQQTDWWSTSGCSRASVPHLGFSHTTVFNGELRLTYPFISKAPCGAGRNTAGDNNIVTSVLQRTIIHFLLWDLFTWTQRSDTRWFWVLIPGWRPVSLLFTPMGLQIGWLKWWRQKPCTLPSKRASAKHIDDNYQHSCLVPCVAIGLGSLLGPQRVVTMRS